ncbi:MAG TPA: helix-turn-helix domain-containing protein [Solirubrobacterales bacterium]
MTTGSAVDQQKDEGLYKALAHPLRREILSWLIERSAGSPSEMAKDIAASLPDISYHARQLEKYGAIELVEKKPTRRGSPEHVYRPMARVVLSNEQVEAMSASERQIFAGQIVQKMMDDLREGFQNGAFGNRSDWELLHHPLVLDSEGYEQVRRLYQRMEDALFEIQAQSDERRTDSKEPPLRISAFQASYVKNP